MLKNALLPSASRAGRKTGAARARRNATRRLRFERLEDRRVLAAITVTSFADNLNLDGQVTLREAIRAAELDISVDGSTAGSGADTIEFATGGDINLSVIDDTAIGRSALLVTSNITIRGNAVGITISRAVAAAEMRLFRVTAAGDLTLESISLTGGIVRGTNGANAGENGGDARGGAIYNQGSLQIVASTLYANQAIGGTAGAGATNGSGRGGAIYNDRGTLSITNSTLSGNEVHTGSGSPMPSSFGGAIYAHNGSTTAHNSTIAYGMASTGRGIYILAEEGAAIADIRSSIIGQNDKTSFEFVASPGVNGQLTVTGASNLIRSQNDFQQVLTVSDEDPLLGPLINYGGPTMTHALAANSPAINLGSNSQSLSTDQRGATYSRVVGGIADIGAFELQTVPGPALLGDYNMNQTVDAADYVLWRKTQGAPVAQYAGADGSGNGMVDPADYGVWRGHFGAVLSTSAAVSISAGDSADIESAVTRLGEPPSFAIGAALPPSTVVSKAVGRHSHTWKQTMRAEPTRHVDLALVELFNTDPLKQSSVGAVAARPRAAESPSDSTREADSLENIWATWPASAIRGV